jgi:hypothetical protein
MMNLRVGECVCNTLYAVDISGPAEKHTNSYDCDGPLLIGPAHCGITHSDGTRTTSAPYITGGSVQDPGLYGVRRSGQILRNFCRKASSNPDKRGSKSGYSCGVVGIRKHEGLHRRPYAYPDTSSARSCGRVVTCV